MPQISVIVPVYNVEKYLHACLDSILAQTFTDFELILIDDGSPDSSGKICDEYAEKDNRIRVFHQENQGQAAARNFGVAQAKADWIHFVDSDDIIHPQMLEVLLEPLKNSSTKISACSVYESERITETFFQQVNSSHSYRTIDEDSLTDLYENTKYKYWIACAKLIRKDLIIKFPFPTGRIYEDNSVAFKWIANCETIAETELALYFYRVNPEGTTKIQFNARKADFLLALEEQIKYYKAKGYSNLLHKICHRYLSDYIVIYNKIICELNDKKFARKIRKHAITLWIMNMKGFANSKSEFLYSVEILFPRAYILLVKLIEFVRRIK